MNIRQSIENTILRIIDYIIIILIILGTQSVLDKLTMRDLHIPILLSLLLIIRIITLIENINKIIGNILLFSFFWVIYISIYGMYSLGNVKNLVQTFILVFLLLVVYFSLFQTKYNIQELLRMYSNIIFIIALMSLFFWLFGSILNIIKPSGTIAITWGSDVIASNYYYLYYQWQNDAQIFGHVIFRNIGIFCEAPMFGLNLSIAFLCDYLINSRRSFKRIAVYFVTIISTFSVTAILLIIMVFVLDTLGGYLKEAVLHKKIRIGLLVFPFMTIVALVIGYNLLSSKLGSDSGSSRMEDYISGYRAWMLHRFMGNGFGDINARVSFSSAWRLARSQFGYTNSIMTVLSEGGLYFFLSYATAFLIYIKRSFKMQNYRLGIFAMMWIYLFMTTTFAHTVIILCFMAIAYSKIIISNIK